MPTSQWRGAEDVYLDVKISGVCGEERLVFFLLWIHHVEVQNVISSRQMEILFVKILWPAN